MADRVKQSRSSLPRSRSNRTGRQLVIGGLSWPATLLALFGLAALWRLLYLGRLSKSPLPGAMFDDSRIYWAWSEQIARGQLVGANPFFLAPLYPYALALLRVLGITSVSAVLIVQALCGAAAVVLLADAARRLTTARIGLAIGVLLTFYEMAVFFDGLILSESLLFLLAALLLWWVIRLDWNEASWKHAGVLGILVGLLAAGRATAAALLVPAFLLIRIRTARLAGLVGGFALVALPITLHNIATAHEWIPFTYNSGFNLYVGNNPRANGTYVTVTGEREGQPRGEDGGVELDGRDHLRRIEGAALSPAASSAHWSRKAREFIVSQPARAGVLAMTKLGMLWNRREYPQIENVEEYRRFAGPLGVPWLGTFTVLGALAVAGAAFAWRAGERARFVLGYVLVVSLSTMPFFVTDRYRHQLIPACALLAALALWKLAGASKHTWRVWGALAIGFVVVLFPAPSPTRAEQEALLAKNTSVRLLQAGWSAARAGRLDEAERNFTGAVGADPKFYDAWGGLIRTQVQLGRVETARATLVKARVAGMPDPAFHAYEGLLAALAGNRVVAEQALAQVPQTALDGDPSLSEVFRIARGILSGVR